MTEDEIVEKLVEKILDFEKAAAFSKKSQTDRRSKIKNFVEEQMKEAEK